MEPNENDDPDELPGALGVIRSTCQEILFAEGIGIDDDLFEWGLDSLAVIRVRRAVESELGVKIPLRCFFEEIPTLRSLCEAVSVSQKPSVGRP